MERSPSRNHESVFKARAALEAMIERHLEAYFHYYNHRRRYQGIDRRTLYEFYFGMLLKTPVAT